MIVPMIEPIAWPPSDVAASASTTRRPNRAASIAAAVPEIPAPSTQTSASTAAVLGETAATSHGFDRLRHAFPFFVFCALTMRTEWFGKITDDPAWHVSFFGEHQ